MKSSDRKPITKNNPEEAARLDLADILAQASQEYGQECGGKGGVPYRTFARGADRITRIMVWHRQYVDGMQLETETGVLPRIGSTGLHHDIRQDAFELEPDEFLTGISIEYWNYIDRIIYHTNKRNYGPFGGAGGRVKKRLDAPPGRSVIGFQGRHWNFIDSLQLIVR